MKALLLRLTIIAVVALGASPALACSDTVAKMKSGFLPEGVPSLCELYDRYHGALDKLEQMHVTGAKNIAEVTAPRFINLPDWQAAKAKSNFDPRLVYNPAPKTWDQWAKAAETVDHEAYRNFGLSRMPPITQEFVMRIHDLTLDGLPDSRTGLRASDEYGIVLDKKAALGLEQLGLLKAFQTALAPSNPIVMNESPDCGCGGTSWKELRLQISWHETLCYDDRWPADYLKKVGKHIPFQPRDFPDMNARFLDEKGEERSCGYLTYVSPKEVPSDFAKLLSLINTETSSWYESSEPKSDPILLAARAERTFIKIHPLADGNGRTSRLVMDYLLESLGLPTPIFRDMNNDVYTDELGWARELGQGMLRAVTALEACAKDPTTPECQPVAPPPRVRPSERK